MIFQSLMRQLQQIPPHYLHSQQFMRNMPYFHINHKIFKIPNFLPVLSIFSNRYLQFSHAPLVPIYH